MKDAFPYQPQQSINCRGTLLDLRTPQVMGILNLTPDSFSDGAQFNNEKSALQHAEKMVSEGASIIDIGAQSTRPKAERLPATVEIERIGNTIALLKKEFPATLISLDTFYADVVRFGYDEGIDLVNDISGGHYDPEMLATVASTGLPYVLMHVNNTYESMHNKTMEGDVLLTLNHYFSAKVAELRNLGVKDIILDPGFGFGKTVEQNHQLLQELSFVGFGQLPVLVGISRKSFIYKPLDKSPLDIVEETRQLHRLALKNGTKILRVHDVAEAIKVVNELF